MSDMCYFSKEKKIFVDISNCIMAAQILSGITDNMLRFYFFSLLPYKTIAEIEAMILLGRELYSGELEDETDLHNIPYWIDYFDIPQDEGHGGDKELAISYLAGKPNYYLLTYLKHAQYIQ